MHKYSILPDTHNKNRSNSVFMTKVYAMLEYCKTVLQKVSFSPFLFGKELSKSINWLTKDELFILKTWTIMTFGDIYPEIIHETFRNAHI